MVPIKIQLDPDDHYIGENIPEYLTIHDTGNVTDSDEGNANYFGSGRRGASAHYFVDDDSITQVVKDTDGAFHCGDGGNMNGINNHNSIGIEMCRVNGVVTAKTEANTLELVRMLMAKYNIPPEKVVRHYDASYKCCPGSFSANNWARWWAFKAKLKAVHATVQNGWLLDNGRWYYFINGAMVQNNWIKWQNEWYYMGQGGVMVANGWAQDSTKAWFYMDSNGRIMKNTWIYWNNKAYFMDKTDGHMLANTITPDGYKVGEDGAWDGKAKVA